MIPPLPQLQHVGDERHPLFFCHTTFTPPSRRFPRVLLSKPNLASRREMTVPPAEATPLSAWLGLDCYLSHSRDGLLLDGFLLDTNRAVGLVVASFSTKPTLRLRIVCGPALILDPHPAPGLPVSAFTAIVTLLAVVRR